MVLKSRSWRLKLRSQRQRILPPQAAKSPGALLSPCPASPSPLRWPLQRWPQQHRGTAARTSGNMAFGCSTHFCASRSVLLSPKDKLLCKIRKSRAWMDGLFQWPEHPSSPNAFLFCAITQVTPSFPPGNEKWKPRKWWKRGRSQQGRGCGGQVEQLLGLVLGLGQWGQQQG